MRRKPTRHTWSVAAVAISIIALVGATLLHGADAKARKTEAASRKSLVIDAHRHVGPGGFLGNYRVEDLLKEMQTLGVDKTVILPMGEMPKSAEEDQRMQAEVEKANDDYFNRGIISEEVKKLQSDRVDHSYVINAIRQHPDKLIGVYMINPWLGKVELDAAEKAVRRQGFRGLKLHPMGNSFRADDAVVDPVLRLARRLRVPVMFHTSYGLGTEPGRVAKVAERFPDVNIIMYHAGIQPHAADAIKAAREHKNIYFDTAHAEPEILQAVLEQVPPEQIVFGTDAPWGKWKTKFELVRNATASRPDVQRLVMGENIARLMRLR